MLNKTTLTSLFSLALAGAMAVPAFAAEAVPARQPDLHLSPVFSEYAPVTSDSPLAASEEAPLTRGELVLALYERAGKPTGGFAPHYADVDAGSGLAEAVGWASGTGIASGYGGEMFGPDDAVTREQMAVILYRYAQSCGQGFTGSWAFPLYYEDAGEISGYAYEAVCWISMKGIMGDAGDPLFVPQGTVSRRDADSILAAYFSAVDKAEISNPFLSCQTMDDAAQIAGFSMELPDGGQCSSIRAVESSMIEVAYQLGRQRVTLRKGIGTQDISGDHSVYDETGREEIGGCCVTLRGSGGKVMVATWSSGGYTYAVRASDGLERPAMAALVSGMK